MTKPAMTPKQLWALATIRKRASLKDCKCPYCQRRGVVSLLRFDCERLDNWCPTCNERLVAEPAKAEGR